MMSRCVNRMAFLSEHIVKDGGPYNYVLLTQPFGKYLIDESIPAEREALKDYILSCIEKNIDLGLCECHNDSVPEPIYFDLDFSLREPPRPVPIECIRRFVYTVNTVLSQYLEDPNLEAYILRKPDEYEKKGSKWHVGYHVEYPHLRTYTAERHIIHKLVIRKLKDSGVFDELDLVDDSKIEDIVDNSVVSKNAIIMYGCNKTGKPRYEVQEIVTPESVNNNLEGISKKTLMETLSIRRAGWDTTVQPTLFACQETFNILRQEMAPQKKQAAPQKKQDSTPRQEEGGGTTSSTQTAMEAEVGNRVKKLLDMLSQHRAASYESWIQVSLCLHNISNSNSMFEMWKEWSIRGCPDKADQTNFRKLWESFQYKEEGLKMGSLTMWAREDSPQAFMQYKMEEIEKRLRRTIDEDTSYDIAKVLREMYDGVFVCSSIRHKTWYEFRKHSYVEIQEGYTLFINISEELVMEYEKKMGSIYHQMANLITDHKSDEAKQFEKQITDIKDLTKRLKDATFKTKIMIEARNLFYDEEFDKKLNEQRHLLVFKNGVYDLDAQQFRSGRPEDYMSFTTGINYRDFDPECERVKKVMHIISEIHPKPENMVFFLIVLAAGLHGTKKEQKLDIWTGTGSNGKSIMIDFLAKALGDFYECPSITMLTRRRQSSSNASPDLAKLKGRRIVSFLEPEYDDTLHTSIIKQFFGNDWIEARALYRDPIKFKAQASGFLSCNDLPKIPCSDGGTWRRLRVLEFTSKFVPNPTKPFERKIDVRLPEQIDGLAEAFMSILIHYYQVFINEQKGIIVDPPDVREFTERWQIESNIYLEFIKEFIRVTDDPKTKVTETAAYEQFKYWCKSSQEWFKPNKHEFRKQMVLRLGEPKKGGGWIGKKLVIPGEEEEFDG